MSSPSSSSSKWSDARQLRSIAISEEESCDFSYLDSGGTGAPLLFLHEFAGFSYTWESMLPYLPGHYRKIRLDCPGFGYSGTPASEALTPYNLAKWVEDFILELDLSELTLIGNGMGSDLILLILSSPRCRLRIKRVIFLSCGSLPGRVPSFVDNIAKTSLSTSVLRLIHSGFIARKVLEYGYSGAHVPAPETIREYADMLRVPDRIQSIITAAKNYLPINTVPLGNIPVPAFLIYGSEDPIFSDGDAEQMRRRMPSLTTVRIPHCGHLPQEESPKRTAGILDRILLGDPLREFAGDPEGEDPLLVQTQRVEKQKPLHLFRLMDRFHPGSLFLILVLKFLQFLRHLGVKAEKHGWRKISGIFLKKEYSKFTLAVFRLCYACAGSSPDSPDSARKILRTRLLEFLISQKALHWRVEIASFTFRTRTQQVIDLMEATVDRNGNLQSITPHFDPRFPLDKNDASSGELEMIISNILEVYNHLRDSGPEWRQLVIRDTLRRRVRKEAGRLNILKRKRLLRLLDRIMTAAFLYVEEIQQDADPETRIKRRFRTPDLKRFRNPGLGLLCIVARFTPDLKEVDLWWQFNHVSVDGAPMQDILSQLKKQWGTAGEVVFPALNSSVSFPETMYCGDSIFRARFYVDFSGIMELRKRLNRDYRNEMNGNSSVAGLLMWGISRHPFFRKQKMLLPVDWMDEAQERQLGLLIIRPGGFNRKNRSPLQSFLSFQKEMNRLLAGIRNGRSESLEFMELCTMLHPFFYLLFKYLTPSSLQEIVGTMGLSLIRDAEVFVSPLTDFQIKGFMSLGSTMIRTENGRRAGSVCVCGTRAQIRCYYEAVSRLVTELPFLLAEKTEDGLPGKG